MWHYIRGRKGGMEEEKEKERNEEEEERGRVRDEAGIEEGRERRERDEQKERREERGVRGKRMKRKKERGRESAETGHWIGGREGERERSMEARKELGLIKWRRKTRIAKAHIFFFLIPQHIFVFFWFSFTCFSSVIHFSLGFVFLGALYLSLIELLCITFILSVF